VSWDLECDDDASITGGAPESGISLLTTVGATCTLAMYDSYGDGWNGAEWTAESDGGIAYGPFTISGSQYSSAVEFEIVPLSPPSPPMPPPQAPFPPSPPGTPKPATFIRTMLTVLIQFDNYTDPWNICDEQCVQAANQRLAALMLEESYGLDTYDTAKSVIVRLNAGEASCDIDLYTALLDANAGNLGVQRSAFTHTEFLLDSSISCGWGGIAYVGGSTSATQLYSDWEWIRTHELGHNYALRHGWFEGVEYGDLTCIMGDGPIYSGAVRYMMNWIAEGAIASVAPRQATELRLRSIESDSYGPGQAFGPSIIVAPYGHGSSQLVFWLDPAGDVIVHQISGLYNPHHHLATLSLGGLFVHNDIRLTVEGVEAGWAKVVFSSAPPSPPPSPPLPPMVPGSITTVVMTTVTWASEISWEIASGSNSVVCQSEASVTYTDFGYFEESCPLVPGSYTLTCRDSWGDGWHGGFVTVNNVGYCGDSVSFSEQVQQLVI